MRVQVTINCSMNVAAVLQEFTIRHPDHENIECTIANEPRTRKSEATVCYKTIPGGFDLEKVVELLGPMTVKARVYREIATSESAVTVTSLVEKHALNKNSVQQAIYLLKKEQVITSEPIAAVSMHV